MNNRYSFSVSDFQQFQPYHLVTSSPWPILTSFTLLNLTISIAMYFNGYMSFMMSSLMLMNINLITLVLSMTLWFRDVLIEGTYIGDHTNMVKNGMSINFGLFIISEVFFFMSIFWSFYHSSLSPNVEIGSNWPPIGIPTINPFELPFYNTILLLSSGATLTYAHHSLIEGNRQHMILGIMMTIILAIIFTMCQGIEYYNAGFTLSDGIYGSTFYFITGFHGFHVIIGTIMIIVSFYRMINYHFTNSHHIGFETSIYYWHFVDIIWLLVFVSVYWWGS